MDKFSVKSWDVDINCHTIKKETHFQKTEYISIQAVLNGDSTSFVEPGLWTPPPSTTPHPMDSIQNQLWYNLNA